MKLFKIPRYILSLVVIAMICYATLLPHPFGDMPTPSVANLDKAVHFIMFGVLAIALSVDAFPRSVPVKHAILRIMVATIISIVMGGIIEILQGAMHIGRSADIYDFLFDVLGAVMAFVLSVIILRRKKIA